MNNEKEQLEKELERYTYLDELNIQEAGKIFKTALRNDIASLVNKLVANKTAPQIDLIKWITEIEVRLDMLVATKNAKINKEDALEELKKIVE